MERTLWVVALVALAVLVMYGMRRGWVRRAKRQQQWLPEFPQPPADPGEVLLSEVTGLYVGTTTADDWHNRIVVGDIGHRAEASAVLYERGLLIERAGCASLWIPAVSLCDARVEHKLANKVIPGAGMLVVTWSLGEHRLDTGVRIDGETTTQDDWARAARALSQPGTGARNGGASARQEEQ